jgi:hypothetical protein
MVSRETRIDICQVREIPDDFPEPSTLVDVQSHGVDVFCWCNCCCHHAVLPVAVRIARLGPGLPFPTVHGGLRCQACSMKDIHAPPNWRGLGTVAWHGPSTQQTSGGNGSKIPEWTI